MGAQGQDVALEAEPDPDYGCGRQRGRDHGRGGTGPVVDDEGAVCRQRSGGGVEDRRLDKCRLVGVGLVAAAAVAVCGLEAVGGPQPSRGQRSGRHDQCAVRVRRVGLVVVLLPVAVLVGALRAGRVARTADRVRRVVPLRGRIGERCTASAEQPRGQDRCGDRDPRAGRPSQTGTWSGHGNLRVEARPSHAGERYAARSTCASPRPSAHQRRGKLTQPVRASFNLRTTGCSDRPKALRKAPSGGFFDSSPHRLGQHEYTSFSGSRRRPLVVAADRLVQVDHGSSRRRFQTPSSGLAVRVRPSGGRPYMSCSVRSTS